MTEQEIEELLASERWRDQGADFLKSYPAEDHWKIRGWGMNEDEDQRNKEANSLILDCYPPKNVPKWVLDIHFEAALEPWYDFKRSGYFERMSLSEWQAMGEPMPTFPDDPPEQTGRGMCGQNWQLRYPEQLREEIGKLGRDESADARLRGFNDQVASILQSHANDPDARNNAQRKLDKARWDTNSMPSKGSGGRSSRLTTTGASH